MTVGRVSGVTLNANCAALVELQVREDVALPADTIASIRTMSLIGDKFLALQPGADDRLLASGDTITDTEAAVDIESLLSRFAFGQATPTPTSVEKGTPLPARGRFHASSFFFRSSQVPSRRYARRPDDAPAVVLQGALEEMLETAYVGTESLSLEARADKIASILERCVDAESITRRAIGPGWRQFSVSERERATTLFFALVVRTYALRFGNGDRPQITYQPAIEVTRDRLGSAHVDPHPRPDQCGALPLGAESRRLADSRPLDRRR